MRQTLHINQYYVDVEWSGMLEISISGDPLTSRLNIDSFGKPFQIYSSTPCDYNHETLQSTSCKTHCADVRIKT